MMLSIFFSIAYTALALFPGRTQFSVACSTFAHGKSLKTWLALHSTNLLPRQTRRRLGTTSTNLVTHQLHSCYYLLLTDGHHTTEMGLKYWPSKVTNVHPGGGQTDTADSHADTSGVYNMLFMLAVHTLLSYSLSFAALAT